MELLPCFLSLQFLIMQSKAKEIMQSNDHIFLLGDLFYRILSLLGSDPKGLTSYRRKGEFLDIPTLALSDLESAFIHPK